MLDLAEALRADSLVIEVNTPVFRKRLGLFFDGDTASLSRTEDVNCLILDFRLSEAVPLKTVRIFPSYSTYDWTLESAPNRPLITIHQAVAETGLVSI